MPLRDNVEKCGGAREVTDGNVLRRMRVACLVCKDAHEHARANALANPQPRTRARARAHTRINM